MLQELHQLQRAMPTAREPEARAFHGGLPGLDEVAKPPERAARGGVWFECGPVRTHLGIEDTFRPARKAHPAFLVSDLRALIARFDAVGQTCRPDGALPGHDRVYTDDPFGTRIELMQSARSQAFL